MSQAISQPTNAEPPGEPTPSDRAMRRAKPKSWMAQVVLQALGRWGAIVGLMWVGLLAFFAVFAPLIASSHPIWMVTTDGEVSSPLLEHLTPVDVTLMVALLAAVLLWVPGISELVRGKRRWVWLGAVVIAMGASWVWVNPPALVVLSEYREGLADGTLTSAQHTLIPFSPNDSMNDLGDMRLQAPTAEHWMGTDASGQDLLSRMLHACRIALSIGFIATGIAVLIGVIVGGFMGFFSGWVDLIGMRLVEVFSAIPVIFLLIAITAFYGRNLYLMMVIIGLTGWVGYALFVRAEFLKLRKMDYVQAAIACGVPLHRVLFRHMLPNGVAPILVNASFGIAGAILAESTLSFLGLGLVNEPSWGQMLNEARGVGGALNWWIAIFPGMAIFLTVFAYNLVGEALRDALDPKTQR